ncbi:MAG: hypothetical protein RSE97_01790 [Oscillospiraceae bacterium]
MKKITLCLLAALLLLSLFTGCKPSPAEETKAPVESHQPAAFSYDKYSMDAYTKDYIKPNPSIYKAAFDAVDSFEAQVDLGGKTLSAEEVSAVAAAVFSRFEFNYLEGISLSADGKALDLKYRSGVTKQSALEARDAFRGKVQDILAQVVSPENSQTENAISLYNYFAKASYNEAAEDVGCYGMMVNSAGTCTGFAYAIRYIFDQIGISSDLAFSSDESHVWNLAKLDGNYYHLDATWESQNKSDTPKMNFFGMSDAQRETDFGTWYCGGNSNYPKYDPPAATDTLFGFLRDSVSAEFDPKTYDFLYTAMDGAKMSFNLKTRETSELAPAPEIGEHSLPNYAAFIAEAEELSEGFAALDKDLGKLSGTELKTRVDALKQKMSVHLKTLEAAYDFANSDLDFGTVFADDIKPEYGAKLQNPDLKKLVELSYKNGFVLKKDAGYIYPEISDTVFEKYIK